MLNCHFQWRKQKIGLTLAKIITVTANTAIDFFIEVDGLAGRDNLQAKSSAEFACGKGINVAKAVESLKHSVICLGFAGRKSKHLFNELESDLLEADLIAVEGNTRTNITLFDSNENRETHIRTAGFTVTLDDCLTLIDTIDANITAGDIVILSGSLPPGASDNFYQTIIENCHRKSAITFLDSSGCSLIEGLKAKPYLTKPNQQELEEIIGATLPDEQSIVAAARALIDQGIEWVCVSRGHLGLIAVSKHIALSACIYQNPGDIVTKIGCGDAMIAGLAVALLNRTSLEDTIKLGVACGTANLYSIEPGRLDRDRVSDIVNHIDISILSKC